MRKTVAWIPDSHLDLIKDETKAFGFLATINKDGSPQLTPVWFNTEGETILINTARGRIKERNMVRNPRVAFVIFDPHDPYRYIQIQGRIVEITEEGAREHIDALARKYTGAERFTPNTPGEVRVKFTIQPEKVQY